MQWHHRSTPGPEERERREGEVKDRMEAEGGKGNREERRKGGGKERREGKGEERVKEKEGSALLAISVCITKAANCYPLHSIADKYSQSEQPLSKR